VCEARNPPIPFQDNEPDLDNLTNAQAVAIAALLDVAERTHVDWRTLMLSPDAADL
jgi:hypothetical protein